MRQLKIIRQITNREAPSLDKYLLEIGRIRLLSSEEEIFLSQQVKKVTGRPWTASSNPISGL